MSTSYLESMMKQQDFQIKLEDWVRDFNMSFVQPMMDWLIKRTFLQRPHTDDMFQMLDDLGIDPPLFQPVSFDGLTFKWR